jgi:hypothetical protein
VRLPCSTHASQPSSMQRKGHDGACRHGSLSRHHSGFPTTQRANSTADRGPTKPGKVFFSVPPLASFWSRRRNVAPPVVGEASAQQPEMSRVGFGTSTTATALHAPEGEAIGSGCCWSPLLKPQRSDPYLRGVGGKPLHTNPAINVCC